MTYDRAVRRVSEAIFHGPGRDCPDGAYRRGRACRLARFAGRVAAVSLVLAASSARGQGPEPELARLRPHVEVLASPEFAGRRDAGAEKTRAYLLKEFRRLGLQPLFGDSFTQDIPGRDPGEVLGVNVGAKLAGTDPSLQDQWVILGVHYDHLGSRGGFYYPGADDNASGVAMMLEVARSLVEGPEKPRRGVIFVGFDLEERGPNGEFGLRGSRFFAEHPPVPLEQVRLFVTADMIGRALGGVCRSTVFVLGSESTPGLRPWIADAATNQAATVGLLGADMLVIDRSDYGPFRSRKIPYLFFTTGENPLYHSPDDVAETLDYPKLEAISRIVLGIVREAAKADAVPSWSAEPDYPVAEAVAVGEVLKTLVENREALKIGDAHVFLMRNTIRVIDGIAARGTMSPAERKGIVRVAQIVLFTVL